MFETAFAAVFTAEFTVSISKNQSKSGAERVVDGEAVGCVDGVNVMKKFDFRWYELMCISSSTSSIPIQAVRP